MQTTPNGLPAEWADVLGSIDQLLAAALKEAAERERQLVSPGTGEVESAEREDVRARRVETIDGRLKAFQNAADQAGVDGLAVSQALSAAEAPLRRWLTECRGEQERLTTAAAAAPPSAAPGG